MHLRVLIVPVELSIARVAQRVVEGGHDVPVGKIRERHARLWALVTRAIDLSHESRVYDSSGQHGRPFTEVARSSLGVRHGDEPWPTWAPPELLDR